MDPWAILNHILTFLHLLYGDPNLPRKEVQIMVDFFDNFIRNVFVPSLKSDVLAILKNTDIADSHLKEIEKCFDKHSRIFNDVASESK